MKDIEENPRSLKDIVMNNHTPGQIAAIGMGAAVSWVNKEHGALLALTAGGKQYLLSAISAATLIALQKKIFSLYKE